MKNKEYVELTFIKCPNCGYNHKEENVKHYGTCTGCKRTLDEKAKFEYEMVCRLRLWKGKKWY